MTGSLWHMAANLVRRGPGREQHYSRSQVRLQLTGRPPGNASEFLIKMVAGDSLSLPLPRVEKLLSEALYRQELQRGASALDIGPWGPGLFHQEVRRILAEMRAEFGYLTDERN